MNTSSVAALTVTLGSMLPARAEDKAPPAPSEAAKLFLLKAIEAAKAKPAAPIDSLVGRKITAIEPSVIGVGGKRKDRLPSESEKDSDGESVEADGKIDYVPHGPPKRERAVPAVPPLTGVGVNSFHPVVVALSRFGLPGSVCGAAGGAGTEKGSAALSATPKVPGSTIIGRLPAMIAAAKEAREAEAKAAAASGDLGLELEGFSL